MLLKEALERLFSIRREVETLDDKVTGVEKAVEELNQFLENEVSFEPEKL